MNNNNNSKNAGNNGMNQQKQGQSHNQNPQKQGQSSNNKPFSNENRRDESKSQKNETRPVSYNKDVEPEDETKGCRK